MSLLLNNIVVCLGDEMFDAKITSQPSWLSSFYNKPCEETTLTHQTVIGLELFRRSYYKPTPRESFYLTLYFKKLAGYVYTSIADLKNEVKIKCSPLTIKRDGTYESFTCIGSLSTYFAKDINDLISNEVYTNIQSLLEEESTYINYTTCIHIDPQTKNVTNIQINIDDIQKQVYDNYKYHVHKDYLETILSENKEAAYRTCLESYKNNDRENFMILCKQVNKLPIEETIKIVLTNLCRSLYDTVKLSTFPMAKNIWLSMSRNRKLIDNIEATGNLTKDLPYMTKKDIHDLIEALQELEEEVRDRKRLKLEKKINKVNG